MSDATSQARDLDRKTLLALLDASSTVAEQTDLPVVFEQVTRQSASVMNAEAASLLVLDESGRELIFQTALGPAAEALRGVRMPSDEGIAGQVLRTGRAVRVDDVKANRNFFQHIDDKTKMQTRSLVAAPLVHQGRALGVVEVLNPRGRDMFDDSDVKLLQIFANIVSAAMHSAQTLHRATKQNKALKRSVRSSDVIGSSGALRDVLRLCEKVASANTTVLITGETGAGKEVAARHIHASSARADQPFVAINCAAISETLLESELFGHEKGAFTGADRERQGWFELADGGTLFLDEIGETNGTTQVKLLRVLQEREFTRVGGSQPIPCDVRLLTATNRDLKAEVDRGRFREDLYYRLNVFPIHMPALRERIEDVPELAKHFVETLAPEIGRVPPEISAEAMKYLTSFAWPGNIRELRNVIERCMLLSDDTIHPEHLPRELRGASGERVPQSAPLRQSAAQPPSASAASMHPADLAEHLAATSGNVIEANERYLIMKALTDTNWNQSEAARVLGVTRDFLRYRISKYGLKQ